MEAPQHTESTSIVPRGTSPFGGFPGCRICGHATLAHALDVKDHFLTKEPFSLYDCPACGYRCTLPAPAPQDMGRYYESPDYHSHNTKSKTVFGRIYAVLRARAIAGKYRLLATFQKNGNVLDLGCGTGEFLAYLDSRGYQVEGVEPSLKAREQAIAEHGLSVVPSLDQLSNQEHYQAITLWHVLEHLPDLRDTMKRLYALLADSGVLIIAVPDRESWDAGHYGGHWAAWDVPRHLHHFRRKDIHRLLQEHGFELIETRRMWLDAYYVALLSERYKGHHAAPASILAVVKGTWSNLLALAGKRPTSSSLFVARKQEP